MQLVRLMRQEGGDSAGQANEAGDSAGQADEAGERRFSWSG